MGTSNVGDNKKVSLKPLVSFSYKIGPIINKTKQKIVIVILQWDQTNLTEKNHGIFSMGNHRNTVGFVGIIFQRRTLDKLRFFSTHFVRRKIMFYGMFYS